jgi:uncharacterized membrane protein
MIAAASKAEIKDSKDILQSRIQSIDFLRGLVMILMAIDHVRVYSGLPPGGPEAGIFFTRWVTHFCAPIFVFLSGTSAYFYGVKINDKRKLSRYLLTRGALLILLEFTVIRFSWTFNFNYNEFVLAGVIWMIGASMMVLGGLVYLDARRVGFIGLAIILFQNLFASLPNLAPQSFRENIGPYWEFIYSAGFEGPKGITILYVLVPWVGVMAAGYGFGKLLEQEPLKRKKTLVSIGAVVTLFFIVFGSAIAISKDSAANDTPFLFQLLNQRKYPASQLFLAMTLGPCILVMPFVENLRGRVSSAIKVFGRVPLFYYLLHIPIIHVSALAVNLLREGQTLSQWYETAPYVWFQEPGHQWTLALLYLVFAFDVVVLFFLCRAYEKYKFSHPEQRWLTYL